MFPLDSSSRQTCTSGMSCIWHLKTNQITSSPTDFCSLSTSSTNPLDWDCETPWCREPEGNIRRTFFIYDSSSPSQGISWGRNSQGESFHSCLFKLEMAQIRGDGKRHVQGKERIIYTFFLGKQLEKKREVGREGGGWRKVTHHSASLLMGAVFGLERERYN